MDRDTDPKARVLAERTRRYRCKKTGTAAAWIAPLPPRAHCHWCWRAIGRAPAHAARPHDANDRGVARARKVAPIRETFTPPPGAAWSTAGGPSRGQHGTVCPRVPTRRRSGWVGWEKGVANTCRATPPAPVRRGWVGGWVSEWESE